MSRIAIFSDDDAGSLSARLLSGGLALLGSPVTLALPPSQAIEAGRAGLPDGISIAALPDGANAFEAELALRDPFRAGHEVVASLPLARVGDNVMRSLFDAVVTVGASPAAAARAMRAARYDTGGDRTTRPGSGRTVPAWFLAGSDQPILRTKARLSPIDGPPLPFATRTLPMVLPRRLAAGTGSAFGTDVDGIAKGTALLLTALTLAIAADPWATRLEAGDLAALMAARALPAERTLSDRLVELAGAYDRLGEASAVDEGAGAPMAAPLRSRDRRHPVGRAVAVAQVAAATPARRAYRA